ncbi:helix-turn-helix domain-containing protein [Sporolactobacillus sp. CPB3-1]|uniref:Helix-turn-helix domain-containing protein n=1 Tax=Sporolactobacillus mangiferae TaxID=2940498 RepID=A0ABT0ME76_9BACL|nr:helix-turn-helix domain-containing protein [Sporolactobacillus mangiferae]MCL1632620.1 helix-turn-helix domain-containing protein [Sporolactobacillus mangiferae]
MRADERSIGYFTKLASEKIGVTKDKLRHLTMGLEKHGYRFTRNKSNQRIYFREDLETIRQLLEKIKAGKTIDKAAQEVCENKKKEQLPAFGSADVDASQTAEEIHMKQSQFHLMIEEVASSAAKHAVDDMINHFSTEFERRIELRDKQLMMQLRETVDEKKRKKNIVTRLSRLFGY